MKKEKLKLNKIKLKLLIGLFLFSFLIYLLIFFLPRNYQKKYVIDNVTVKESYSKNQKTYHFNFDYKTYHFSFLSLRNYTNKRGLITKIEIKKIKNGVCLIPKSAFVKFYPLCNQNKENISYTLIKELKDYKQKVKTTEQIYKQLKYYYLNDKTYIIWNYHNFYVLNNKTAKTFSLFANDYYNIFLVTKINQYLFIPNYDLNDFIFSEVYLFNLDKLKLERWKLEKDIYFASYILGTDNKSLFLFDKKEKKEYELVPSKQKLREIKGKIIQNGNWINMSTDKLANQEYSFTKKKNYNYELIAGQLFLNVDNYKIRLSHQQIKSIVYEENEEVYYLVDDKLYLYNPKYGEVLLMENFEWNFNYNNQIFIY